MTGHPEYDDARDIRIRMPIPLPAGGLLISGIGREYPDATVFGGPDGDLVIRPGRWQPRDPSDDGCGPTCPCLCHEDVTP